MVVDIGEDYISILDDDTHKEVVYWNMGEWEENPNIVISIANALRIYYSNGVERLKEVLKTGG